MAERGNGLLALGGVVLLAYAGYQLFGKPKKNGNGNGGPSPKADIRKLGSPKMSSFSH